ncbi:MAG: IPT/TIG domain-containing protein [bacterium]|jgi:hypothetical protein
MCKLLGTILIAAAAALALSCGGGGSPAPDRPDPVPGPSKPAGPPVDTDSTQQSGRDGFTAEIIKDTSGLPTGVRLTWDWQSEADGGYNVYRDTNPMEDGLGDPDLKITDTPIENPASGPDVTYDDLDFDPDTAGNQPPTWGETYYYRVTNINDTNDESDVSNELNITIGAAIDSFNPGNASILDAVTVEGEGFGDSQEGGDKVQFHDTSTTWIDATVTSWSDTAIDVTVPVGAITGHVRVVLEGTQNIESTTNFTVDPPAITNLSSGSGRVGDTITITGTDFENDRTTAQGKVFFGSVEAASGDYVSWSDTSIQVKVPTNAVSNGDVKVKTGNNESNVVGFDVLPKITDADPNPEEIGENVTITGFTFGSSQGDSFVEFGTETATITSWSSTSIELTVPGDISGNVNIKVTVKADVSGDSGLETLESNLFSWNVKPSISSLSNNRRTVQQQLTINGDGFGASRGTSTVWFDNGTPSNFTDDSEVPSDDYVSWSQTAITIEIPDTAKTGSVYVKVANVSSDGESITIVLPPPNLGGAGQI